MVSAHTSNTQQKDTTMANERLYFASDYQEGAHPDVLRRLVDTNMEATSGYGTDPYSDSARQLIRQACDCADAEVFFLVGGTQTNATCIDAMLESWQGVIAADSGHVNTHEAGAIEYGGHKVLALPADLGKLSADAVDEFCSAFEADENRDHMVAPGMVYISQPTELGTLYSLEELTALREICTRHNLMLYADGARLAYALACDENGASLADLARLCDVFYIGGTKCGCLIGEAVVIPQPGTLPHFFTVMKQHGALLAKGRTLGVQFEALFADGLYTRLGESAIRGAQRIRERLGELGVPMPIASPTNQTFCVAADVQLAQFAEHVEYSFWEHVDETHSMIRLCTSWATGDESIDRLLEELSILKG